MSVTALLHKNFTVSTYKKSRQKSPAQVINSASWALEFNYICFWEPGSLVECNTRELAQQHFQIKGFQFSAEGLCFQVFHFFAKSKLPVKSTHFVPRK